jgi:hypothetical protein
MRRAAGELVVCGLLLAAACADTEDMWRTLARACQVTAGAIGRLGIYAESRATVLTAEGS